MLVLAACTPDKLGDESMKKAPIDTVFAQGEVNPYGKYFTGITYLTMLSGRDNTFNAPIGNVTFEPGARTNWHKHDGGQILLVLNGEGRYQEKGGEIRVLKKGDVVRIAPGVIHWHGAGQLVCAYFCGNQLPPKRLHRLVGPGNE